MEQITNQLNNTEKPNFTQFWISSFVNLTETEFSQFLKVLFDRMIKDFGLTKSEFSELLTQKKPNFTYFALLVNEKHQSKDDYEIILNRMIEDYKLTKLDDPLDVLKVDRPNYLQSFLMVLSSDNDLKKKKNDLKTILDSMEKKFGLKSLF